MKSIMLIPKKMTEPVTGPKARLDRKRALPAPAVVQSKIAKNRTEIIGAAVGQRRALLGKTVPPDAQHIISKKLSDHKLKKAQRISKAIQFRPKLMRKTRKSK